VYCNRYPADTVNQLSLLHYSLKENGKKKELKFTCSLRKLFSRSLRTSQTSPKKYCCISICDAALISNIFSESNLPSISSQSSKHSIIQRQHHSCPQEYFILNCDMSCSLSPDRVVHLLPWLPSVWTLCIAFCHTLTGHSSSWSVCFSFLLSL